MVDSNEDSMRTNMRAQYQKRKAGPEGEHEADILLATALQNLRPEGTTGSSKVTGLAYMYRTPAIRYFLASLTPIIDASLRADIDVVEARTRGFGRHYYDKCALFSHQTWKLFLASGGGVSRPFLFLFFPVPRSRC